MIIKTCPICWETFKARRNKQKFCSQSCSSKSHRTLQNVACATCGKIFLPVHKKDKYCSRKCAAEGHKKWRICPVCWKEFNKKSNMKYCSQECYVKSRTSLDIECPVCWKLFHPNTWQRYCSNSCRWVAQRTHKIKVCPVCEKEFREIYIGQVYCSNECYNSTREIKEKKCPICWKIFKPYSSGLITCSKECHSKYKKMIRDSLTEEEKQKRLAPLREQEEKIISKPNRDLAEFLTRKWFDVTFEYSLEWLYYDLKVWNTLIEVNPWAHHNSTWVPPVNKHAKPKSKYYHQYKAINAIEKWFNIIMVRDWVSRDTVVELLKSSWLACEYYIPANYDISKIWEPTLHRYRKKWKSHLIDDSYNKDDMVKEWYVEIYDAWQLI